MGVVEAARRRIEAVALALVIVLALAPAAPANAATALPSSGLSSGAVDAPGLTVVRAAPAPTGFAGRIEGHAASFSPPANSDFVLEFDPAVDATTRSVVTAAAGVWSAVLDTVVPVTVEVRVEAMQPGLLGAAGPTTAFFGRASFPEPDVLYPAALANQFAGQDLQPGVADMELVLSSTMDWDTRTDGTVAPDGQSLLSVAVHEIGHGLGHTSWVRPAAGGYAVSYDVGGSEVALAFDTLVETGAGVPIDELSTTALTGAVGGELQWAGPRGVAANDGAAPALYAPDPFELGSSVGHLDEATYRSNVMTPFLARGEVHTSIPELTQAMFEDFGWTLESDDEPAPPPPLPAAQSAEDLARSYVSAVVTDFLQREPSAIELDSGAAHLLDGGSREAFVRGYAFSDEWIGVIVDGFYRSTLGRSADAAGRAHWVDVIRSGRTPAEVAAFFYASDEYFTRSGGSAPAWIADLYEEILGRRADAGGLAFWVEQTALRSRADVAHDFYQSLESRRDRVAALFDTLLGRTPDAGGWAYWADVLRDGRDVELAVFLAVSDEYWSRSGRRFG